MNQAADAARRRQIRFSAGRIEAMLAAMLVMRTFVVASVCLWGSTVWAQTQPPPPSSAPTATPDAAFPSAAEPAAAPTTAAPAASTAPATPPPYAGPPADPPYAAPPAQPAPAAQPPPSQAPAQQAQPQPAYAAPAGDEEANPAPSYAASAPQEEPPSSSSKGSGIPDFSVRIDPLNWVLYGQLGFELELEIAEWLTIETVPMFVVSEQPVVFNQADDIYQKSAGVGPLAGASLSFGFWLDGDSFNGTVLRPGINFYSTEYRSEAVDGFPGTVTHGDFAPGDVVDSAVVKERRLSISIGSQRSWGYFTLAGGFGLEYELRKDRRCVALTGNIYGTATAEPECRDDDVFALAREPLGGAAEPSQVNLFGGLHPFYLAARLSLGVVFDKED